MREKLLSFGDDYWIEDSEGRRAYRIDGKALRLRQTMDLLDAQGGHLCRVQTRVLQVRDTMVIEGPDGGRMATVHKAMVSPLRHRWKVDLTTGELLETRGIWVKPERSTISVFCTELTTITPELVAAIARSGDLVVCLGAGSVTAWANALPAQLRAILGENAA